MLLVCGDIENCPDPQTLENVLQTKNIKIFHQNCRSLFRNVTNFISFLSEKKNAVITLSETHIESFRNGNKILGDVNINYLKKTEHREIKDMIELQGFMQLIESSTRITDELNTLMP